MVETKLKIFFVDSTKKMNSHIKLYSMDKLIKQSHLA